MRYFPLLLFFSMLMTAQAYADPLCPILPGIQEIGIWEVATAAEAVAPRPLVLEDYPRLNRDILAEYQVLKLWRVTYHDELSTDHITCLAIDLGATSRALGLYSYLTGDAGGATDIPCLYTETDKGLVYQRDRYVVVLSTDGGLARMLNWMKTFCRRIHGKILGGCGQPRLMQALSTSVEYLNLSHQRYGLGPLAFGDLFSPTVLKILQLGHGSEVFTCSYRTTLRSGQLLFVRYRREENVAATIARWTAYYDKQKIRRSTIGFGHRTTYIFREEDGLRLLIVPHGPYLLAAMGSTDAVVASRILEKVQKKLAIPRERPR